MQDFVSLLSQKLSNTAKEKENLFNVCSVKFRGGNVMNTDQNK